MWQPPRNHQRNIFKYREVLCIKDIYYRIIFKGAFAGWLSYPLGNILLAIKIFMKKMY